MKAIYLLCFVPALFGCGDILFDARHHSKGDVDSGDVDVSTPPCNYDSTEMGTEEVTPLGFPASDVLDLAVGSHGSTFGWLSTGTVTDLALDLTLDGGDVLYQDGESTDGQDCPDHIEAYVVVELSTDDGGFDETFSAALWIEDSLRGSIEQETSPESLQGTWSFPAGATDASLTWQMIFQSDGTAGEVEAHYTRDLGDGVASDTQETVGRWPSDTSKSK